MAINNAPKAQFTRPQGANNSEAHDVSVAQRKRYLYSDFPSPGLVIVVGISPLGPSQIPEKEASSFL